MNRTSNILTGFLLFASMALVIWWTWFQVSEATRLEEAGAHLVEGAIDEAARSLGSDDARSLSEVGRSRRRMFLSEGLTFIGIVSAAGLLLVLTMRKQRRVMADHDRFLAGATHELKTPLATIQLLLESLRDDRVPAEKRSRYLQSGLLEAARLESGLTNVLTAAGLRSSAPRRRNATPGDLAEDVRQIVETLRQRADAAGVALEPGDLPTTPVTRDSEAIHLVLHNLLENAIKYTPTGGAVRIHLRHDGGEAVLVVEDTGAGMDRETLANAFVAFWRGNTGGSGGTGLGLHLAQKLIAAEGGSITATSAGKDQGTTITVWLPLGADRNSGEES